MLVHRNNGDGDFANPIALPLGSRVEGTGLVAGPVADSGLVGVSVPGDDGIATWVGKGAVWLGRIEDWAFAVGKWVGARTDTGFFAGGLGLVRRYEFASHGTAIEVWRGDAVQGELFSTAVETGRLDGDHLLDVAVLTRDSLVLLRGRADRGLEVSAALPWPGEEVYALTIADVTGDGLADVVASDFDQVWLAQPTEDAGYSLHSPIAPGVPPFELVPLRTGPDTPAVVVAFPVHETGPAALVPGASLLRFAADGGLAEEILLVESLQVLGVCAVDFDEDGRDELLVYGRDDQTAMLVHMSPDGASYTTDAVHDLSALSNVGSSSLLNRLAVGDVDGDGQLDAVVDAAMGALTVLGLPGGSPTAVHVPDINPPRYLRDLDGDGVLDAVTPLLGVSFWYHRGRGDGTFESDAIRNDVVDAVAGAFASVPDAQFDLVHVDRSGIATHFLRSVARPVAAGGVMFHGAATQRVVGDLDRDGFDDIVTAALVGGGVAVLWGSEDGPLTRADGFNRGFGDRALALGDVDGDGELEVLSSDSLGDIAAVRFASRERAAPMPLLSAGVNDPDRLAVVDVDADGLLDLVALIYFNHSEDSQMTLSVARGTAPGAFAEFVTAAVLPMNSSPTLELGDVDGDGDLDVLVSASETGGSVLLLADAPGTWGAPILVPGHAAMFSPPDADGRVDLVSQEGATIYRHRDGAVDDRAALMHGDEFALSLLRRVVDLDGDGRHDLVVVDEKGTHVWLRREDGPQRVTLSNALLFELEFPDVDGDGRRDLVALGEGGIFVRRTRR